jgi:protein-L-isoaspartate(D-aspartate) O-methyltransferase
MKGSHRARRYTLARAASRSSLAGGVLASKAQMAGELRRRDAIQQASCEVLRARAWSACSGRWACVAVIAAGVFACSRAPSRREEVRPEESGDRWGQPRAALVDGLAARGIRDARVLAAMRRVPRHEFVPDELRVHAYEDRPLPIGLEQTISQPFVVAAMTEAAQVAPRERVLEIGTGSGYQAAVLVELGADVYSIEIVEPLARRAEAVLARLGYRLHLRVGNGYAGWPEAAPFDAIVVTAAPEQVPPALIEQLAIGGRMVIPVGSQADGQRLDVITRGRDGTTTETLFPVRFVPMTGGSGGN